MSQLQLPPTSTHCHQGIPLGVTFYADVASGTQESAETWSHKQTILTAPLSSLILANVFGLEPHKPKSKQNCIVSVQNSDGMD